MHVQYFCPWVCLLSIGSTGLMGLVLCVIFLDSYAWNWNRTNSWTMGFPHNHNAMFNTLSEKLDIILEAHDRVSGSNQPRTLHWQLQISKYFKIEIQFSIFIFEINLDFCLLSFENYIFILIIIKNINLIYLLLKNCVCDRRSIDIAF